MKKFGLSEQQQLALTLMLSEKIASVESELQKVSANNIQERQELEQEIEILHSISKKSEEKTVVIGREFVASIPDVKYKGLCKVNADILEGRIYVAEMLFEDNTLKIKMLGNPNVFHMKEFVIDHMARIHLPLVVKMAETEIIVNFELHLATEDTNHIIEIGRNPLAGMLVDIKFPFEEDLSEGVFLNEGWG